MKKLLLNVIIFLSFLAPSVQGSDIDWLGEDPEPEAELYEWMGGDPQSDLLHDLEIVNWVNNCLDDKIPTFYNHLLHGGYFNMPSALMAEEGDCGCGFSYVLPYRNYNLRFQFTDRVEISGNYRIFNDIPDPLLTETGFGDMSDKGANIKFQILKPEDCNYRWPALSVGLEDFIGTKSFKSRYIVMTQMFRRQNLEVSLGYGKKRIRGWFGGFTWIPFRKSCNSYLNNIALVAEYDAIPYESEKREPHPDGRSKKSPINYGLKYRLWDFFDFSVSYVRGEEVALSISNFYNFGCTQGIMCKKDDPLPYTAPFNTQPLGPLRPDDVLVQDLLYPLEDQGFELQQMWLSCDYNCNKILRINVRNNCYRYERDVRCRLNYLLAALIPSDISHVIVVMDGKGFPTQEYHFPMEFVRRYGAQKMGPYELKILSPLCDVTFPNKCYDKCFFKRKRDLWNLELAPKIITFFGSAKGKFKYALGINAGFYGYLWQDIYYSILFGYNFSTNLYDVKDVDKLNPSQIINVRTDTINYLKQDGITVDEAFLQKSWNMGRGWYSRLSGGLFEEAYGGLATELLWYPTKSCLALGIEGAVLRKRSFSGIGFTDKIRKLNGYQPTFRKFLGSQFFVNAHYHMNFVDLDLHLKGGKFLANDWGVKTEISRYYPSGMRVYFWYTYTNGHDKVNGRRYYDKGVAISLPLDIFSFRSTRHRWTYGMSAWLRDVGASSATGYELYYLIRDQREE